MRVKGKACFFGRPGIPGAASNDPLLILQRRLEFANETLCAYL